MELSQTELWVLEQLAQGNNHIKNIAEAINKSSKQIYRTGKKLKEKGFLTGSREILEPARSTHTNLLLQLLAAYPNLAQILSGSGIIISTVLFTPKTAKQIAKETGIKKSMIYKKLKIMLSASIVKKEKNHYLINEKLWSKLKEFLMGFESYQETIDQRIPANSIIYYKTDREIVFSNKAKQDATLTAFSVYGQYGIKLLLPTNYYYLPKKRLSKKEVFLHSLYVAEKEKNIRYFIYVTIYYTKFKKELPPIKHPILNIIKIILKGKIIQGYPALKEIKEKAEIYNIRL